MSNINNNVNLLNNYTKSDWEVFLKQGAYRGLKINKLATHLAKSESFIYDQNKIFLKYKKFNSIKGYKSIDIRIEKLLRKNDRWTMSRLIHNIRMWFPDSQYALDFNDRISKLAAKILEKPRGLDDLPNETQQIVFENVCKVIKGDATVLKTLNKLKVTKNITENIEKVEYAWINETNVCLKTLGCKSSKEAVQCVINRKLTSANFSAFPKLNDATLDELITKLNDANLKELITKFEVASLDELITKVANLDELIKGNSKLTKLSISSDQISGDKLAELIEKNPNLESLMLKNCTNLSDDRVAAAIGDLTKLRVLDLEFCSNLATGKLLERLEKKSELESLNLFGCRGFSYKKIPNLLDSLPKIKFLNLYMKSSISEELFTEIIKKLPSQKALSFSNYTQISEEKFGEMLEIHSKLTVLDLDRCTQISEVKFLEKVPKLVILSLRGCAGISEVEILKVPLMFKNLQRLDISQCPQISEEAIAELVEKFPKIKIRS